MILPPYSGFYFVVARTARNSRRWHSCKEYFGRELGAKRPKGYVTVTVWNGYADTPTSYYYSPINTRAKELQNHLNAINKEYQGSSRFVVHEVENFPGCLRIRVPRDWCNNRVTAHLFATHVRHFLSDRGADNSHLNSARVMLDHAKVIGLEEFNS